MSEPWNDKAFKQWLTLRDRVESRRRAKDWKGVIKSCQEVLDLAAVQPSLGILPALFSKKMAEAYEKTGDVNLAITALHRAKDGLEALRATGNIAKPTDWLDEIGKIDRRILKLAKSV